MYSMAKQVKAGTVTLQDAKKLVQQETQTKIAEEQAWRRERLSMNAMVG